MAAERLPADWVLAASDQDADSPASGPYHPFDPGGFVVGKDRGRCAREAHPVHLVRLVRPAALGESHVLVADTSQEEGVRQNSFRTQELLQGHQGIHAVLREARSERETAESRRKGENLGAEAVHAIADSDDGRDLAMGDAVGVVGAEVDEQILRSRDHWASGEPWSPLVLAR